MFLVVLPLLAWLAFVRLVVSLFEQIVWLLGRGARQDDETLPR